MTPAVRRLAGIGACAALLGAAQPDAQSATLVVGPGHSLPEALQRALDGDEIAILPGTYRGQVGTIAQKRLTLRGIGARPVLEAAGRDAEGKAILVVRDGEVRIENLEFRGARVPDGNGAGIRFEKGRLTVSRCVFVDNQNGILTANFADAELRIEDSEFAQAPPGTALPHLIYVGRIARFTLIGSRVSGGRDGHLVKSRARVNHVLYNQLVDGAGGRASYELDLPNGGLAFVIGNVMGQNRDATNPVIVSFGAEGSDGREQGLYMANNTLINEGLRPAYFVRVDEARIGGPVPRRLVNNLFVGLGVADVRWTDLTQGNVLAPPQVLQDVELGQYALDPDSLLRHRGVEPGVAHGESLAPAAEFMPPVGTRALSPPSRWSPGAYQF